MTRPRFESSLATLRDNIVMAIERRELGVVQDGLEVYEHLIEVILDEQVNLEQVAPEFSQASLPLGREWEQIVRDLHGIMDSVSASRSRLLWVDVLSWTRRVAVACVERESIWALSSMLGLFETAWNQELSSRSADSTARQDAFLLRLSELGTIYLQRSDLNREVAGRAEVVYTRTFMQVMKSAVESEDPEAAQTAIKYFLRGESVRGKVATELTSAAMLSLYGWILYLIDHGREVERVDVVRAEIERAFSRESSYIDLLDASDRLEKEFGVHWWEFNQRGPTSGGVMQISHYITLALLIIAGPRLAIQEFDPHLESHTRTAQRLLAEVESLESGGFPGVRQSLNISVEQLVHLKRKLRTVIEEAEVIVEESYSRIPLDVERLSSFKRAVVERLASGRAKSLATALLTSDGNTQAEAAANFGLDSVIPRWYFADTGVFADPKDLAKELAEGLIHGEEDRILGSVIGKVSDAPIVQLEDLKGAIERATEQDESGSLVIVTNSYLAHSLLATESQGDVVSSGWTGKGSSLLRVFDDRDPYVALLSRGVSPLVRILPPRAELNSDEQLPELGIIVGVSELAPNEIAQLLASKERSRLEEARLRGSVRVRILEHLEVNPSQEFKVTVWALPESTY